MLLKKPVPPAPPARPAVSLRSRREVILETRHGLGEPIPQALALEEWELKADDPMDPL